MTQRPPKLFFATVREVFQLCQDKNWIRTFTVEPFYAIALQLTQIDLDYSPKIHIMLETTLIPPDQKKRLCILRGRHTLFINREDVCFQVLHFLEDSKRGPLYLRESLKLRVQELLSLSTGASSAQQPPMAVRHCLVNLTGFAIDSTYGILSLLNRLLLRIGFLSSNRNLKAKKRSQRRFSPQAGSRP